MATIAQRLPERRWAPWRDLSRPGLIASVVVPCCLNLVLAYSVRLWGLEAWGLWYDEGHSFSIASRTLPHLLDTLSRDVHPPLYFLLLKAWLPVFGQSEFSMRYLSVIASVLTVVAGVKLALLLADRRAAVAVGFLIALSPLQVVYGQEARMYALAGLLPTLAACLLVLAWRTNRARYWVAFAVVQTAAVYTHYYTGLVLVALGLAVLAQAGARGIRASAGRLLPWALAEVATLAVLYPWATTALDRLQAYGSDWLPDFRPSELAKAIGQGLLYGPWQEAWLPAGFSLLALLVLVVAAVLGLTSKSGRRATMLAILWLGLSAGVVFYASLEKPMFHPRYLVQAVPAICLLAGVGLTRAQGRWAAPGALAVAVLGGILAAGLAQVAQLPRDDTRGVALYLAEEAGPADIVLIDAGAPFQYYRHLSQAPFEILPSEGPGDEELRLRLTKLARGRERVYHVRWRGSSYDPKEVVRYYLRSQAVLESERVFSGFRVDTFLLPPGTTFPAPQYAERVVQFERGVRLTGVAVGLGRGVTEEK